MKKSKKLSSLLLTAIFSVISVVDKYFLPVSVACLFIS